MLVNYSDSDSDLDLDSVVSSRGCRLREDAGPRDMM